MGDTTTTGALASVTDGVDELSVIGMGIPSLGVGDNVIDLDAGTVVDRVLVDGLAAEGAEAVLLLPQMESKIGITSVEEPLGPCRRRRRRQRVVVLVRTAFDGV